MPQGSDKPTRSFASDNNASVHPAVLAAISEANTGHTVGYGDDPYTQAANGMVRMHVKSFVDVLVARAKSFAAMKDALGANN